MDEYDRRRGFYDMEGPMGEDGPMVGGYGRPPPYEMMDGAYDDGMYASRRPPPPTMYDAEPMYGSRLPGRPAPMYMDAGGYGRGYGSGYGGGYGGPPEPMYYGPAGGASDLGMGLMDSRVRTEPDYGSTLSRPDFAGVPVGAYEGRGRYGRGPPSAVAAEAEYEEERRHKHMAEAAGAAALAYGVHERRERKEEEERSKDDDDDDDDDEDGGGKRKHWFHLFGRH